MSRPIYEIAKEIKSDWKTIGPNRPYLEPLFKYNEITDKDPQMGWSGAAESAVLGFLCNCSTWKGDTAKRIKNELRSMAKLKLIK